MPVVQKQGMATQTVGPFWLKIFGLWTNNLWSVVYIFPTGLIICFRQSLKSDRTVSTNLLYLAQIPNAAFPGKCIWWDFVGLSVRKAKVTIAK